MTVEKRHYAAALGLHAALFALLLVGVQCTPKVQPPPVIQAVLVTGQNHIAKQTEVEQRVIEEEAKPVPQKPPEPEPPPPPPPKKQTEEQIRQKLIEQKKAAAEQEIKKQLDQEKKKQAEEKKKQDDLRKAEDQKKKAEAEAIRKQQTAEIARKKAEVEEAQKKEKAEVARKKAEEEALKKLALEEQKKALEAQKKAQEEERKRVEAEQKQLKAQEEARKAALEAEEKRKADDERKRREDEAKRLADEKRRKEAEAIAARDAVTRALRAEEDARAEAAYISTVQVTWAQELSAAIAENWVQPQGIAGNPNCQVQVDILPSGQVVKVVIVRSSGIPTFDDSVIRAIYKTDPLPLPKDPKAFERTLKPTFDRALLQQGSRSQ